MNSTITLKHKFVEYLPDILEDQIIYICMEFAIASHKCICGCGQEVVTPFSPTDWSLIFDGESISLDPSIGNWSFPCQSHYWIKRNKIRWSTKWSKERINAGRKHDMFLKEQRVEDVYYADTEEIKPDNSGESQKHFWQKTKNWVNSLFK